MHIIRIWLRALLLRAFSADFSWSNKGASGRERSPAVYLSVIFACSLTLSDRWDSMGNGESQGRSCPIVAEKTLGNYSYSSARVIVQFLSVSGRIVCVSCIFRFVHDHFCIWPVIPIYSAPNFLKNLYPQSISSSVLCKTLTTSPIMTHWKKRTMWLHDILIQTFSRRHFPRTVKLFPYLVLEQRSCCRNVCLEWSATTLLPCCNPEVARYQQHFATTVPGVEPSHRLSSFMNRGEIFSYGISLWRWFSFFYFYIPITNRSSDQVNVTGWNTSRFFLKFSQLTLCLFFWSCLYDSDQSLSFRV